MTQRPDSASIYTTKVSGTFAIAILLLFSSCQSKNMTGTYVANYGHGKDTLILLSNATFLQHYSTADGKTYTNSGTWAKENRNFLELSHYLFYAPPFGHNNQPQLWATGYHTSWSKTTITVQEDSNYYYLKVR